MFTTAITRFWLRDLNNLLADAAGIAKLREPTTKTDERGGYQRKSRRPESETSGTAAKLRLMNQQISAAGAASSFFVGSGVDDAGLNVYQFRVLGHLMRRAGSDGKAWPSLASIAETCQICRPVVQRTLRELVKLGLITAQARPGQSTLYRPAQAPSQDLAYPPSEDLASEGIPIEGNPTPAPERAKPVERSKSPPERPKPVVVVGAALDQETVQNVKSEPLEADQEAVVDTLAEFGIIGAKRQALARSGLTAKEVRRTCREVRESGGRAGAMVFRLEDLADRKARGKVSPLKAWTPAKPPPTWQDDMTEAERAEVVEACRKFRQTA